MHFVLINRKIAPLYFIGINSRLMLNVLLFVVQIYLAWWLVRFFSVGRYIMYACILNLMMAFSSNVSAKNKIEIHRGHKGNNDRQRRDSIYGDEDDCCECMLYLVRAV